MQLAVDANSQTNALHNETTIVRHTKRPTWGLAVLLWERDGKRGYRFEDGSDRTFKSEYCGMFLPADASAEVAEMLQAARKEVPVDPALKKAKPKKFELPLLEDQVAVFRQAHMDGFASVTWLAGHRGSAGKRRLKRHRDAAVAEAKTLLSKEALDELLATGRFEVVFERACAVLEKTDLVSKRQLEPLRSARRSSSLALALRNYLHESDSDGVRFDEFLRQLGRASSGRISWPLMTALRALVNPETDVCLKPSVFLAQAALLSPSLGKKSRPMGATYNRWAAMAADLRAQLAGLGLEPADMLDVYDFVWQTLRPAAAASVEAARVARVAATPVVEATVTATDTPAGEPVEGVAVETAVDAPTDEPDEAEAA